MKICIWLFNIDEMNPDRVGPFELSPFEWLSASLDIGFV